MSTFCMQAELVMTVQQALPMRIWRSAVICRKVIDMDEELTGLSKYFRAYSGYSQHVKKAIARAEETANMVNEYNSIRQGHTAWVECAWERMVGDRGSHQTA